MNRGNDFGLDRYLVYRQYDVCGIRNRFSFYA